MPLKSTLSKIAHSLSDEKKLAYLPPIVWEPTTLSHGYPGLIIAFSLMHQHFPDEGWDTVSRKYASLLLHEIAANGIKDASLFPAWQALCGRFAMCKPCRSLKHFLLQKQKR